MVQNKLIMKKVFYFGILIISTIAITSCSSNLLSKDIRNDLHSKLMDKEINIGRNGNSFIITTYYNYCKINFLFEGNKFIEKTAINCSLNNISKKISDSLLQNTQSILDLINKFNINASTNKFLTQGIPLKLYMKDNSIYLYCPDTTVLTGDYVNYVKKSMLIDAGWYYKKVDN